ncbi:MAG TPA: dsDNA nuclease domain-containing protein [Candidatus Tumulicola sp.]|jgi:hypothetical protein
MTDQLVKAPADPLGVEIAQSGGTIAQSRFTYQHTVGALLAFGLLDDEDMAYVYCETVDDLLLEQVNGDLTCVQVTSREHTQPALKAKDEKVVHTFATFCETEAIRTDVASYRFVASCGFFTGQDNSQNLVHVLAVARTTPFSDYGTHAKIKSFFKKIKAKLGGGPIASLPKVVEKADLQVGPPLPTAYDKLYTVISETLKHRQPSPACVKRIHDRLVKRVEQAASQRFEGTNTTYIAVTSGSAGLDAATLAVKRIGRAEMQAIVDEELALRQIAPVRSSLTNDAFPTLRDKLTLNGASENIIVVLQQSAYHAAARMRARQISEGVPEAERLRPRCAPLRHDFITDYMNGWNDHRRLMRPRYTTR